MSRIKIENNKLKRHLFFGLGIMFMVLGVVGFILPFMPGTIFLIIATLLFARSSEKFHNMILHNKYVGKYIHYYYAGGKMPLRAKIITFGMIAFSLSLSLFFTLWVS